MLKQIAILFVIVSGPLLAQASTEEPFPTTIILDSKTLDEDLFRYSNAKVITLREASRIRFSARHLTEEQGAISWTHIGIVATSSVVGGVIAGMLIKASAEPDPKDEMALRSVARNTGRNFTAFAIGGLAATVTGLSAHLMMTYLKPIHSKIKVKLKGHMDIYQPRDIQAAWVLP